MSELLQNALDRLEGDARGLVPVVVQDPESRRSLWLKGETSGNFLHVTEVRVDCDTDALLYRVRPDGPVCHTGEQSCFYRTLADLGTDSDAL